MLLKYKKPGPWSISLAGGGRVLIKPGVNDIPDADWRKIKEVKDVQERLESKLLEVIEGPKGEKKPGGSDDDNGGGDDTGSTFDGLGAKAAKELVLQTYDTELLNKWLESETRKGVTAAIEKQLADIEAERQASENSGGGDE